MSAVVDTGHPFSPEAADAINQAYQDALGVLDERQTHSERRAMLARVLVDLARSGEHDTANLRDRAVAAIRRIDWLRHQAHEIWESEGRPHGRHDDHWAQAEREWAERGHDSV